MSTVQSPEQASATPTVTELELESALLRSIPEARPIGRHKHLIILKLQTELHRRTGLWIASDSLWDRLDDLYDLNALDDLSSNSEISLPSSPRELSPLVRTGSLSPPPEAVGTSAAVINSMHFKRCFALPVVGVDEADEEEEVKWLDMIYARAGGTEEDWAEEEEKQMGEMVEEEVGEADEEDDEEEAEGPGEEEEEEEGDDGDGAEEMDEAEDEKEEGEEEEEEISVSKKKGRNSLNSNTGSTTSRPNPVSNKRAKQPLTTTKKATGSKAMAERSRSSSLSEEETESVVSASAGKKVVPPKKASAARGGKRKREVVREASEAESPVVSGIQLRGSGVVCGINGIIAAAPRENKEEKGVEI
ncbi:hypothetical protein P7C73_g233, partial [Tremellales sp. Uapishka_1]